MSGPRNFVQNKSLSFYDTINYNDSIYVTSRCLRESETRSSSKIDISEINSTFSNLKAECFGYNVIVISQIEAGII
jgi:hypothetical protein